MTLQKLSRANEILNDIKNLQRIQSILSDREDVELVIRSKHAGITVDVVPLSKELHEENRNKLLKSISDNIEDLNSEFALI